LRGPRFKTRIVTIAISLALGASAVALLAPRPTTAEELKGFWLAADGGSIALNADGSFVAHDLSVNPGQHTRGDSYAGTGTWELDEGPSRSIVLIQWEGSPTGIDIGWSWGHRVLSILDLSTDTAYELVKGP
jgi:hypothetical protein